MGTGLGARRVLSRAHLGMVLSLVNQCLPSSGCILLTFFGSLEANVEFLPIRLV